VWTCPLKQGNIDEIAILKGALSRHGITFRERRVKDQDHARMIRESRIAPAIQGQWQVNKGYIPCRIFKNMSYGQLGITNSPTVAEMFGDCVVFDPDINALVDKALALSPEQRIDMTRRG